LLTLLAPKLASITLALEGTALEQTAGTVLFPSAIVRWQGEHVVLLPAAQLTIDPEPPDEPSASTANRGGSVLCVPTAELLSGDHVAQLQQRYGVQAIVVGGAGILAAITECALAGTLAKSTQLCATVVAAHYLDRGRPDLATIRGLTSLAIAKWNRLGRPPPPPDRASATRRERPKLPFSPSSHRTVRIKA
jgi:hypothetical protein